MFFILSKILFFLIQPIIWLAALLIWSILTKSQAKRKKLLVTSFVVFFVFSNSFLFNIVSRVWENQIPNDIKTTEHFDVAIVLGGISGYDDDRDQQAFYANAERLFNILPMYHNGRVEKILFAGGSGKLTDDKIEAVSIRDYLISIGIQPQDILIDTQSRNTYENAKYSTELLQEQRIRGKVLLSTSATHMYRSVACFSKLGLEVKAFPVDYVSSEKTKLSLDTFLLPDPRTLNHWYWLFHEWAGLLSYKIAGYC